MGGLIYKDFLAVKGKRITLIILLITLLFVALRLALPGTNISDTAENGEFTFDFFLWIFPALFAFVSVGLPSMWTKSLIANDEKSKVMAFAKSLPFGKNTYIASKYIFNAGENQITVLVEALMSFLIVFACISVFIVAIELPFFITLGSKKAQMIKTLIMEMFFLLVIAGLFFGDLEKMANIDLLRFVDWYKTHSFTVNLWAVVSPVVSSVLYYLSYKLTCALNKNREVEIDG